MKLSIMFKLEIYKTRIYKDKRMYILIKIHSLFLNLNVRIVDVKYEEFIRGFFRTLRI